MGQGHNGDEPTVRLDMQIPQGLVQEAKVDAVMTETGIQRWLPAKRRREKRRGTVDASGNNQMRYT